jgi:DHA2 family methylenomycin A resistance protein-like MFS transporter
MMLAFAPVNVPGHKKNALLFVGLTGNANTMPAMTAVVIASAPGERPGTASGVLNASRQVGQALGIACLGSLAAANSSLLAGMHSALLLAGLAFLLACVISALLIGKKQASRAYVCPAPTVARIRK